MIKIIVLLILMGYCKSKHENILQRQSVEDDHPVLKSVNLRVFKILHFDHVRAGSTSKNDKLEPVRDVFEIWNWYLPDRYAPGSSMTVVKPLLAFRGHGSFQVYVPSKPGKYGINVCVMFKFK